MSSAANEDAAIVIHAPPTGDAERLAGFNRPPPGGTDTSVAGPLASPSAATPTVSVAPAERVFGLDAFRGLLLLAMNFTFTIPPAGPFAKWMYHTQVPPSATRAYVDVAGLTWQDLLFAMFVFTMAAAIPIAMNARLARGKPYPDIIWSSLRRGFYLLLLALIIGHVNPYWTNDYTKRGNIVAIVGLLVSFALFVQPPRQWSDAVRRTLRNVGWAGVIAVLFVIPWLYGQRFASERRDFIMAALAFTTVAGTLVWLFTRMNLVARLLIFGVIVAGRFIAPAAPTFGDIWNASPIPWFYQPWYLDLLLVVIPGTIAGELIWRWMRGRGDSAEPSGWSSSRLAALSAIALSFPVILCVGLYERRYPLATTVVVVAVSAILMLLAGKPTTERDRVLTRLFAWAALWLAVGMLVEPLEGGIKKDPQTLGFLLLMSGASTAALGGLLIVADTFQAGRRFLRPLALIGQNALFAYVILMLGIEHVMWLAGVGDAFTSTWQLATMRSATLTILVAVIVWLATKKHLVWKA